VAVAAVAAVAERDSRLAESPGNASPAMQGGPRPSRCVPVLVTQLTKMLGSGVELPILTVGRLGVGRIRRAG